MTLIISAISPKIVALACDTRHTLIDPRNGRVLGHKDQKVKSIIILGQAGWYIIGYCGRADIRGVNTDTWLAEKLTKFGAAKKPIEDTINNLCQELERINDGTGLSIVFAGVKPSSPNQGSIGQCVISNFEKIKNGKLTSLNKTGEFAISYLSGSRKWRIIVNGAEQATKTQWFDARMQRLARLLKSYRPSKSHDLKSSFSQLIKIAAANDESGHYISKSCIVTILPLASMEPESAYFDAHIENKSIAPHVIGENISFKNLEFSGLDEINPQTF